MNINQLGNIKNTFDEYVDANKVAGLINF